MQEKELGIVDTILHEGRVFLAPGRCTKLKGLTSNLPEMAHEIISEAGDWRCFEKAKKVLLKEKTRNDTKQKSKSREVLCTC